MGLQDEYAAIAQGMRLGTLRPAPDDKPPDTWICDRFSNSPISANSFGEQYNSQMLSSCAFSFGNCSRSDAKRVYASRELSKASGETTFSPGPQMYDLPVSIGPKSGQHHLSTMGRSRNTVFGTDSRDSAENRERKALS